MQIELDLINLKSKFPSNPVKIFFGRGCRSQLRENIGGKKCLVITSLRGYQKLKSDKFLSWIFCNANNSYIVDVPVNPTVEYLDATISKLVNDYEAVIAIGGGSVIDVAKVVSVVRSTEIFRSIYELQKCAIDLSVVPLYVLPTTSGSGSEVTPYASIWSAANKKKISMSGVGLFPFAAYVDPELCDQLPVDISISCGLDAINQASESIWNLNATADSIYIASQALKLGFTCLPEIAFKSNILDSRDGMSLCSLLSGLAISQTRTALCHSISYPLTAHYAVPHGLACAFTMPQVLKHSINVNPERFIDLAISLCDGQPSLDLLQEKYNFLNRLLMVEQRVMDYVGSLERLLALKSQMINKERSANSLFTVSEEVIESILMNSYQVIKLKS